MPSVCTHKGNDHLLRHARSEHLLWQDAIGQYDTIMQGNPDHQTGFNLVLCYYALEDGVSVKKAFQRLAAIPVQASAVCLPQVVLLIHVFPVSRVMIWAVSMFLGTPADLLVSSAFIVRGASTNSNCIVARPMELWYAGGVFTTTTTMGVTRGRRLQRKCKQYHNT